MQEDGTYKGFSNNERSYVLSQILTKSNNIRATLKIKYLINRLEKSFGNKKPVTDNKNAV